ncbi:glycosyltransferase [Streptomyces sp. NPDC049687]|uniref:glycosyltransferase n=1 Tax=Streptomyces sp. NPDC049687 TaxID=3365596 RepID=UPI0037A74B7C
MIKVTVIVPVYNAGSFIDECAPSLLGQSLGPGAYEVLYVDDGSTDDSARRLKQLAADHSHVRVHHQENSGWPGRPRNVGVRLAQGEYVQFVDQDDKLAPEALERMLRLAERNRADIVLGKVFGTMAGPSNVFKRSVDRCTAADARLFESLTPHKMFRRDFLLDHGIVFPEGRVRLEDQVFMARAYVRARTVSIVGDYPCYEWNRREDGGNNSSAAASPEEYYRHVRNVIDAVKEGTEPGDLQDHLLRRTYRVEVLRPVTEPRVLQRKGAALERYFGAVRDLARECFPPGVREGLPPITRLRATLLEAGRLDSLVELASRTANIRPHVSVDGIHWHNGALTVTTTVGMLRPDGQPLTVVERHGRLLLDPELLDGIPGAENFEAGDPFGYAYGELLVHDTGRDLWWYPDADVELAPRSEPLTGGRHRIVVSGETRIDPLTLAGGHPMEPGIHQVWGSAQLLGVGRRARLAMPRELRRPLRAAVVGDPARVVVPGWSGPGGQLRLDVGTLGKDSVSRRLMLRAAADPRLRTGAHALLRRLPYGPGRRAIRGAAARVDRWTRS